MDSRLRGNDRDIPLRGNDRDIPLRGNEKNIPPGSFNSSDLLRGQRPWLMINQFLGRPREPFL